MIQAPHDIAKDYASRYWHSHEFPSLEGAIQAAILADRAARPMPKVQLHYGMTKRQQECFDFLRDHPSASFDEIRDALGLNSKSGVHRLVTALDERGLIRRLPNRARSIVVVGQEG